ncbi:MAG: FdrA family protein [Nocardioidaceae bacterium]|nr:FdrA family protein [Nocardioidaceae bacterium]
MTRRIELRAGTYRDSVTLMEISQAVSAAPGVSAAIVAMATPLNLELYERLGFDPAEIASATPNDLMVAVEAGTDDQLAAAIAILDARLTARAAAGGEGGEAVEPPRTLSAALRAGADLCLISLPGEHAAVEAMDAIESGTSVMLFSDNVTVEEEIRLKDAALEHQGVLVMGPDCGTAVVGGVGLGFANAVRPGPVGMVAASGTGAQQVSSLVDRAGVGLSAILGVGGRDLSRAVGGRSTLRAMTMLDEHPGTELVVVLSKPPDPLVAEQIVAAAAALTTPSVVAFVGRGRKDLTAVSMDVLRAMGVDAWEPESWSADHERLPRPGSIRGLFSGGTLCDESMAIAAETLGPVMSNTPLEPDWQLPDGLTHPGHLMIDFGDDKLTQGRAHPMIDPSLRNARILEEAADASCAVILLDVVLGYGSHRHPADDLVPVMTQARETARAAGRDLAFVVSLVGTSQDPQGLDDVATRLVAAGASVHLSNAEATRQAVALIEGAVR